MHLGAPSGPGRDLGHLTYCTNIHAGEPLEEVMAGLARHLPAIKQGVAPDRQFGVGLRLGHAAAEGLRERGRQREQGAAAGVHAVSPLMSSLR